MPRQTCQDGSSVAFEAQGEQAGMAEEALYDGGKGTERETIARRERRRECPVFGPRAMITGPEGDGDEPRRVGGRYPAGEADLDRLATAAMFAAQARRKCRGIIGDHEVARVE
jgi:hypothetical protein